MANHVPSHRKQKKYMKNLYFLKNQYYFINYIQEIQNKSFASKDPMDIFEIDVY